MRKAIVSLLGVGLFLLAGCGGQATTQPEPPAPTSKPAPSTATPTLEPPTATPEPTQIPGVGTDITIELPEGDAERGRVLAKRGIPINCVGCHVGSRPIGPNFAATDELPAIGERGAMRIAAEDYTGAATTPEQYLFESIVLPQAHLNEGRWMENMPADYDELLSSQDVADLVAYLLTLTE